MQNTTSEVHWHLKAHHGHWETESPFCTIWSSVLFHAGVEMGIRNLPWSSSLSWRGESSVSLVNKLPARPISPSAPLRRSPVCQLTPVCLQSVCRAALSARECPFNCHLLLLLCLANAVPIFVSTSTPILLLRPWVTLDERVHSLYCSGFQPRVISTPKGDIW